MSASGYVTDRGRYRGTGRPHPATGGRAARDGELTAGQIAEQFSSSRPAVSRHLRLLREAGVVSVREEGTRRLYQLQRQPLADLEVWLAQRLDALDTELRRGNRGTTERGRTVMTDDLRTSGATRAVHLERTYPTSPADLWTAWTDPDRLARWLGTPAGPILDAPAPVRIAMGGDDDWVDVQIVQAQAPRLLELRWEFAGEPAGLLRVELTALPDGTTRLVLDHDGLTDSSTGYGAGWQAFLDGPLAALFGGTVPAGGTSCSPRRCRPGGSAPPRWAESHLLASRTGGVTPRCRRGHGPAGAVPDVVQVVLDVVQVVPAERLEGEEGAVAASAGAGPLRSVGAANTAPPAPPRPPAPRATTAGSASQ